MSDVEITLVGVVKRFKNFDDCTYLDIEIDDGRDKPGRARLRCQPSAAAGIGAGAKVCATCEKAPYGKAREYDGKTYTDVIYPVATLQVLGGKKPESEPDIPF